MAWLRRNVALGPALRLTPFRKIALGTWRTAGDPSVYGSLELDAGPALAYVERLRARSGVRVTLTHFTGRVLAEVLRRHPEINCVRRGSSLHPRKSVDIFFQIASDRRGDDLSGAVVRDADRKSVIEVARELEARVREVREHGDPAFRRMKRLMRLLPAGLVRFAIRFTEWLTYDLNLWTPLLGTPRDPFGGLMLTSIGSLDMDEAYAPLVPYSRVPVVVALGAARERPVVRDGKVVAAPTIRLCATFDHRLIDGVHGAAMAKTLRAIFADPDALLGPP